MPTPAALNPAACRSATGWPPAEIETIRRGLAQVASGAAIASCWSAAGPRGVLARATTVSLAPPRLLLCLDKSAAGHDALLAADTVGLSLLSTDQRELAEIFRGAHDDRRFDPERWRLDSAKPPELRDALAVFTGFVRCRIDAGSATLFILDVATAANGLGAPLLQAGAGEIAPSLPASLAH